MDEQLHSPARLLIELRMLRTEHAELNGRIDALSAALSSSLPASVTPIALRAATEAAAPAAALPVDELTLRRLKKQRLALRDQIARLEQESDPDQPA